MVDHLTEVVLRLDGTAARAARVGAMAEALAARGFAVRRERRRVVASSTAVEAGAAKALLRARGFEDPEFQIGLEYFRAWGVL